MRLLGWGAFGMALGMGIAGPRTARATGLDLAARPYGNAMGDGLRGALAVPPLGAVTCAAGETLPGIDVSYYQGNINWAAVAASGVKFAFVRVSHSTQFRDPEFLDNWTGARAAGIHTGVYQYFEPDEDPIAQANLLLDAMGPLSPGDLPPVIDVESNAGQSSTTIINAVRAWIEHVEAELGVQPIIYTGRYFWQDFVGNTSEFNAYPLWIAHYTNNCPNIPNAWPTWQFHQYCDCGTVPGISGAVDVNEFNGDLDALGSLVGEAACGDGRCSSGEDAFGCAADCPPCGTIDAGGLIIDNGHKCYELYGGAQFWREVQEGFGGSLLWTHTTDFAAASNYAIWRLYFVEAGQYRIEAHLPAPWGESERALYRVAHAEGESTVTIDQTAVDGWVELGVWSFEAARDHWLRLDDNTGEANNLALQLTYDAIRITAVELPSSPSSSEESDSSGSDDGGEESSSGSSESTGVGTSTGEDGAPTFPLDPGFSPDRSADAGCGCRSDAQRPPLSAGMLACCVVIAIRRRRRDAA